MRLPGGAAATVATRRQAVNRGDVLLALGCAAVSIPVVLGTVAILGNTEGVDLTAAQVAVVTGMSVLQSLLLIGRRLAAVGCLAAIAVLQVVVVAAVPGGAEIQGVAFLVAAYTVGATLPIRAAGLGVIAIAVLETLAVAAVAQVSPGGAVPPGLVGVAAYGFGALVNYLGPTLLGVFVATRRAYTAIVATRAEESIAAERSRADRAVRDERARMAREVHDVAAHHLSGMVVQAGAVERLIGTDPGAATTATRALRLQGRQTLASLRQAVGILRDGGPATGGGSTLDDHGGPVPGVAALPQLVATAARDVQVSLETAGEPWPLPPLADVSAYRVVMEALSNARQHAAGAPVRARLAWHDQAMSVEVVNDPPDAAHRGLAGQLTPDDPSQGLGAPAREGLGLIGMRERAELVGGTLEASPTPAGGWKVSLRIPRADQPHEGVDW